MPINRERNIKLSDKEVIVAKMILNNFAIFILRKQRGLINFPDDLIDYLEEEKKRLEVEKNL